MSDDNNVQSPAPTGLAKAFLNAAEAADFLRVKLSTIYAWVHQRRLLPRKHGSRLVFERDYLEKWSLKRSLDPTLACRVDQHVVSRRRSANCSLKTESGIPRVELTSKKRGQYGY